VRTPTQPIFGDQRGPSVAYIVRSYPRLSQTFILDEICTLEQMGMDLRIFAVTNPQEPIVQLEVADVQAPTKYLHRSLRRNWLRILVEHVAAAARSPRRYARALHLVITHRDGDKGYAASTRYECFVYAVHLVDLLRQDQRRTGVGTDHIHAHFAHDPTLVAMLAHVLTGVSYSFTAHARDLYQVPQRVLLERTERASAIVTCCRANVEYLYDILPERLRTKVRLIYHGKEPHDTPIGPRSRGPAGIPLILSVGRLVEKKGFMDLALACHQLKQEGRRFRCVIYGEGPDRSKLQELVERLDLADRVSLLGARSRREIVSAYLEAYVFALTPFVLDNGDRDGIPNVLIEAMACGLPAVTTTVGGIPELVRHNVNGLLATPRNVAEIAAHLGSLLDDEERLTRLSECARETVERYFNARTAGSQLAELFEDVVWGTQDLQPA
jgi:glycosyltransferase involved in cell wall biosynthesis